VRELGALSGDGGPERPPLPHEEYPTKDKLGPDNLPGGGTYWGVFFITMLLAPIGWIVAIVAGIVLLTRNLIGPAIAVWACSFAGTIAAVIVMGLIGGS
jgi:hypothetical protein